MTETEQRDKRVDRAQSWIIGTLVVVALAVVGGLWRQATTEQRTTRSELKADIQTLGKGLGDEIKQLRAETGSMKVDVGKLQEDRKRFTEILGEQRELRARLRTVETKLGTTRVD